MVLEALLRHGGDDAMIMVNRTCEAMARGGICDQLGGGFARYSVDARWVVPHFEKMLYDNALLLGVYTHWWRLTGTPLADRVVRDLMGWLLREMRTEEGGFAASLDADSLDEQGRHREGAYYAWNREQLNAALGPRTGRGRRRPSRSPSRAPSRTASRPCNYSSDPEPDRLADVRARLLAVREQRPRPSRDDKVVVAWNGWLICSMIDAAMIFEQPPWLESARTAGRAAVASALGRLAGCAGPRAEAGWGLPRASWRITRLSPRPTYGSRPPPRSRSGSNAPTNCWG